MEEAELRKRVLSSESGTSFGFPLIDGRDTAEQSHFEQCYKKYAKYGRVVLDNSEPDGRGPITVLRVRTKKQCEFTQ